MLTQKMANRYLILLLFINSGLYFAQINNKLKSELDEILFYDQKPRELIEQSISSSERDSILKKLNISGEAFFKHPWKIVSDFDSINLTKIDKIIQKYGYPGKSLVGEKTNEAAWFVIQHSNSIKKYFPLIRKAGKNNEIPMTLVAMMKDRMLMEDGKEQEYGTQIYGEHSSNEKYFEYVWPIRNPKKVNKRRKSVGFKESIEEYVKYFDLEYKILTLEDVEKLRKGAYSE